MLGLHEGFCIWPSEFTNYSVKQSPWRNGQDDVVREVSKACREAGLGFGFYLSPFDLRETTHGTPGYDQFFKGQLRELLTDYGDIKEVWFDGHGAERHQHDWAGYHRLIHQLQPGAVIRTALGPCEIDGLGIRWFGFGEKSRAVRASEWSVIPIRESDFTQEGHWKNRQAKLLGDREQLASAECLVWWPAEFDIPIRRGWFYHADEEGGRSLSLAERFSLAEQAGFDGVDLDEAASFTPEHARLAVERSGVFVHNAINHGDHGHGIAHCLLDWRRV